MKLKTNLTSYQGSKNNIKDIAKIPKLENSPSFFDFNRLKRNINLNYSAFFSSLKVYDLKEAYRIIDTESFVRTVFTKKVNLILKEGYILESENQDDILYVKKRLAEISYVSNLPFKTLLKQITNSLVHNHNSYIYIVRDSKSSTESVTKRGKQTLQPIAGLFYLPETQVDLVENMYNSVIGYRYFLTNGIYNEFNTEEVCHLSLDCKPKINLGTPPLEPVKDDILSLRQIEESLERLIYKLSIPLIHAKVGTEDRPATQDRVTGLSEVQLVNEMLLNMEEAGGITTNERVEIKMLGAESQALRLQGYIDHFKNRVLVGLSASEVDIGQGTNTTGGAAAFVSELLKQNVEMYQDYLSDYITEYIITPILLEKEENKGKLYLLEDEKVFFKFNKSDVENKIKLESHYINEVNHNLMTADEYRVKTGKRELLQSEKNEFLKNKGLNPDGSKIGEVVTKSKQSSNPISNYTNPTNQHTKSVISDELNIPNYIKALHENNKERANNILSYKLHNIITEVDSSFTIEDSLNFLKPLTNSLDKYIIGIISNEKAEKIVENLLSKNILEYIKTNT